MSKAQGSNVDCRCDGAEMSVRDQREGTRLSDLREGRCDTRVLHAVETQSTSEKIGVGCKPFGPEC